MGIINTTIVTKKPIPLIFTRKIAKMPNNQKLKETRMPVILHEGLVDKWLVELEGEKDQKYIEELIQAYPEDELEAHTVSKLRGKELTGNVEGICDPAKYAKLVF